MAIPFAQKLIAQALLIFAASESNASLFVSTSSRLSHLGANSARCHLSDLGVNGAKWSPTTGSSLVDYITDFLAETVFDFF
jgi:hypothetical protein